MKSMWRFFVLMLLISFPMVSFGDVVKGIIGGVHQDSSVYGWVCDVGSTASLQYIVYARKTDGTLQRLGGGVASNPSEAAVDQECGHAGVDGSHRFAYAFAEIDKVNYQGRPIVVRGTGPGLTPRDLVRSGQFTVPRPSQGFGPVIGPAPPSPTPTPTPTPTPSPTPSPEPVGDTSSGSWTYGANVSISAVMLWQESETNPLYFKRSDNVWCYVPAGEPTLQSLILTLYSSGNGADIHCRAEPEQKMLGVGPAHKLHRIIAR